jgi:hypothetical protein
MAPPVARLAGHHAQNDGLTASPDSRAGAIFDLLEASSRKNHIQYSVPISALRQYFSNEKHIQTSNNERNMQYLSRDDLQSGHTGGFFWSVFLKSKKVPR